jgi:hypothetical protein
MIRKFLIAALAVVAFGCARSASTPATATVPSPRPRPVPVAKPREPRTLATPAPTKAVDSRGVALHGPEKSYVEQIDNSGWSGRSPAPAPTGVGGGPPEYEDEADDEQKTEK